MAKRILYIKYPPVLLQVVFGYSNSTFVPLSYNAIVNGRKDTKALPLTPAKMEDWLIGWSKSHQSDIKKQFKNIKTSE